MNPLRCIAGSISAFFCPIGIGMLIRGDPLGALVFLAAPGISFIGIPALAAYDGYIALYFLIATPISLLAFKPHGSYFDYDIKAYLLCFSGILPLSLAAGFAISALRHPSSRSQIAGIIALSIATVILAILVTLSVLAITLL